MKTWSAGTPSERAMRAWACRWRISPCTGMTWSGRTSPSTVFSSSAAPWPDTCTGAVSWCSTVAPARQSWFMVSCTASSLPGTGLADMITVSPGTMLHGLVVVVGDAGERRERLALRPGAEDHDAVGGQLVQLLRA